MVKQFLEGDIDTIEVIYSALQEHARPGAGRAPGPAAAQPARSSSTSLGDDADAARARAADSREILFEPGAAEVLDALLPFYVNRQIYQLALSGQGLRAQRPHGRDEDRQGQRRPSCSAT